MGLLIQFVVTGVGVFTTVYMVVATVSVLAGFIRFLVEAPGAIRHDMERWRETHAGPPRIVKYVQNEVENAGELGSPRPALPPHDDSIS
jgi:hypothetical protein